MQSVVSSTKKDAKASPEFSQKLLDKLIPAARKPMNDVTLSMLAPGLNTATKAKLKIELQKCWSQCQSVIDHRNLSADTQVIEFGKMTHYVCVNAIKEFERQKKLYKEYYTLGFKRSIDNFAETAAKKARSNQFDIGPWRLTSSDVGDFRRVNGERLILASRVRLLTMQGKPFMLAKTGNISVGGCLLTLELGLTRGIKVGTRLVIEFVDLAKKYQLKNYSIGYEVVNVKTCDDRVELAFKRINKQDCPEFSQLIMKLMKQHQTKGRTRVDVDNTVCSVLARGHKLASIAQLNSLMVMSHYQDKYHLLVSQGHTLSLQAELTLNANLIPRMVEITPADSCKMYFVWALSQSQVYLACVDDLTEAGRYEQTIKVWSNAPWHKLFFVKADEVSSNLVALGTTLPANISALSDELNAPLPDNVTKFSRELSKMSLIDDITYIMDELTPPQAHGIENRRKLAHFELGQSAGVLRQLPFNLKELPNFFNTFRFSHDCELTFGRKHFRIVNGHANANQAVVSLPLKSNILLKGMKVTISWLIDETRISIDAWVQNYNQMHKRVALKFCDAPELVSQLFEELQRLNAFDHAFVEDVQANKLDLAVRNLVLSNLPKVSVFAQVTRQGIGLSGVTGHQYLPERFIDNEQVKLDALFSSKIVLNLAKADDNYKDLLVVAFEGQDVVEQRLASEYSSANLLKKVILKLCQTTDVYVFAVDVSRTRPSAEDDVIAIENKYLRYYNPTKAKQLSSDLAFNLAIQLVDVSDSFGDFIQLR